MPNVYIAVFKPESGNYYHWAMFTQSTPPKMLEVAGSHPDFERSVIEQTPEDTDRHLRSILVGEVNDCDMNEFYKIMNGVNVDNETTEWNCQDYEIEALDALAEECVLDGDVKVYKKGVRRAKDMYFGPI